MLEAELATLEGFDSALAAELAALDCVLEAELAALEVFDSVLEETALD